MKRLSLLLVTLVCMFLNEAYAQNDNSFTLTASAYAIGTFSGDKPKFDQRKVIDVDIYFYNSNIRIDNNGQTTFELRNKKDYSNDTSVAFRYDATDNSGKECVVMFEIYSDRSVLNIFYEDENVYIRYYIIKDLP